MIRLGPIYNDARAITTSDTVNLPGNLTDAIWVGGAGIVVAVFPNDNTVNFTCVAGSVLPIRVKRVNATTTTATLLVALYSV
jgi:hypothetical protein